MARKSQVELAKTIALKRLRNRVRLEMAVRGDIVLNEIEEDFHNEFDRRVSAGEAYELTSYEAWVVDAVEQRFPALPAAA